MTKHPAVTILASQPNGILYIGVASDLAKRSGDHKTGAIDGFTKRYGIHTLVWFEIDETMPLTIEREKQMKKWRRAWKISLIEQTNPCWDDLYAAILR
ncbi:GIY-YIG nuclease family protein [Paramagnetospirillum marisnigri]|uniref:GIY-YIG nuclease family protein n=1 Tax=Paramagnetospirillum marisnigri TaxID=1285242 RepID=UPI000AD0DA1D|nr:GIY-YIG nuclease family protein [Paramagnetospirillum marisnigri]